MVLPGFSSRAVPRPLAVRLALAGAAVYRWVARAVVAVEGMPGTAERNLSERAAVQWALDMVPPVAALIREACTR